MHQSPQKQIGGLREKYAVALETADDEQRPSHRVSQGKVRKLQLREDSPREQRGGRVHPKS